ncbi:MAG TPA: DedA family protein [Clostridiales bacterium]|nr:DedA family protein [Clostridiales bacterium]
MNLITNFISDYGLLAMFLIIMLEYACFPVSSEIVLPFSGAFASANQINYFVLLPLSIIAGLIGTGFCFCVGWYGGGAILQAIIKKYPKAKKGLDAANEKFNRHGAAAVCIGRVIPLIRTYIALIAGASKLNPVTYFAASALGISVWNTMLIGLGYALHENYRTVGIYYERYKHNLIPVALICLAALLFNFIYKRSKSRSKKATRV